MMVNIKKYWLINNQVHEPVSLWRKDSPLVKISFFTLLLIFLYMLPPLLNIVFNDPNIILEYACELIYMTGFVMSVILGHDLLVYFSHRSYSRNHPVKEGSCAIIGKQGFGKSSELFHMTAGDTRLAVWDSRPRLSPVWKHLDQKLLLSDLKESISKTKFKFSYQAKSDDRKKDFESFCDIMVSLSNTRVVIDHYDPSFHSDSISKIMTEDWVSRGNSLAIVVNHHEDLPHVFLSRSSFAMVFNSVCSEDLGFIGLSDPRIPTLGKYEFILFEKEGCVLKK